MTGGTALRRSGEPELSTLYMLLHCTFMRMIWRNLSNVLEAVPCCAETYCLQSQKSNWKPDAACDLRQLDKTLEIWAKTVLAVERSGESRGGGGLRHDQLVRGCRRMLHCPPARKV